jgi:hypothetical protein
LFVDGEVVEYHHIAARRVGTRTCST